MVLALKLIILLLDILVALHSIICGCHLHGAGGFIHGLGDKLNCMIYKNKDRKLEAKNIFSHLAVVRPDFEECFRLLFSDVHGYQDKGVWKYKRFFQRDT